MTWPSICESDHDSTLCRDRLVNPDGMNADTSWATATTSTAARTRRTRRGCSGRPCRRPASSGPGARSRGWGAVVGHAAGHADSPAVAAEELPILQPRGLGDGLDSPGDLGLGQPEHPHITASADRPDSGERVHGGGRDGHSGALGLGVGLRADHGDAAGAVVPALHVAPSQRRRLGAPQPRVGEHGHQGHVKLGPFRGPFRGFEAAAAPTGLDGGEADDGQGVGGEGAGLALGPRKSPSPSFQGGSHTRITTGRFQLGPFVGLRDGGGGQSRRVAMLAPEFARAAR